MPGPTAQRTPPTGYTLARTITIAVYNGPNGKPPGALLTDGTYVDWCSGADRVRAEVLNRLSPRVKTA
jgi:hypothetical protein